MMRIFRMGMILLFSGALAMGQAFTAAADGGGGFSAHV